MPVTYTAHYPGAVARDLSEKLSDFVTPMDFGAVGDGVADDTVAVQAALDSGRHVMLVSNRDGQSGFVKHLITAPLNVTTDGQRIFGSTGAGYMGKASINFPTLGANQAVINVKSSGVVLDSLIVKGRDSDGFPAGSSIIFANEDAAVGPDTANNGDVDLTISQCSLGEAETLVRVTGRTIRLTNCNLVRARDVLQIDWPADFEDGPNDDNTALSGMRGYTVRDNRIHGCTGGYIVTNIGANKANMRGLMVIGNFIDTNIRLFRGVAKDALFSDNVVIHSTVAAHLVHLEAGSDSVRIASNIFYGMEPNRLEATPEHPIVTREIHSGVLIAAARNVSVDGNHFKRVNNAVVDIGPGSANILVRNNVMKDVCLANIATPAADRAPVRVNGWSADVDGLVVDGNIVDQSNPTGGSLIGIVNPGSTTIKNLSVGANVVPTDMYISDFSSTAVTNAPEMLDTAQKVIPYEGDGNATQAFTLKFTPSYVTVTQVSGAAQGQSVSVGTASAAASGLVEITGRVVTVKGAWNTSSTAYTLFAVA
ncbi:hypothetical protein [Tistrella mobilis]